MLRKRAAESRSSLLLNLPRTGFQYNAVDNKKKTPAQNQYQEHKLRIVNYCHPRTVWVNIDKHIEICTCNTMAALYSQRWLLHSHQVRSLLKSTLSAKSSAPFAISNDKNWFFCTALKSRVQFAWTQLPFNTHTFFSCSEGLRYVFSYLRTQQNTHVTETETRAMVSKQLTGNDDTLQQWRTTVNFRVRERERVNR